MPSRKQLIYIEMLRRSLPMLRSVKSLRPWHFRWRETLYQETELIHNLYVSILSPEYGDHDVWLLNHQARWYQETGGAVLEHNLMLLATGQEAFDRAG